MEAYAIHKNALIKPRLARMTMDLIRGKDVETARGILENTNTKASRLILKVLNSAVGFVQKELGKRLRLRRIPNINFIATNAIEHAIEISKKIDNELVCK